MSEFDQIIRETPIDLVKEHGIYGDLAVTLLAEPYLQVSIKKLALKVAGKGVQHSWLRGCLGKASMLTG